MKKLISLALALILIYSSAFAVGIAQSPAIFEKAGFAVGEQSPMPESLEPGQKYIETLKLQQNGAEAELRTAYRLIEDKTTLVAAELSFTSSQSGNRQELISRLSGIINGEGSFETDPFYKGAIAFLSYINGSDDESSSDILRQILAQHEINAYFPDSPMQSYVDSEQGEEGFDSNVDEKAPVLDGKKYFLKITDEGYILSLRITEDNSTIELQKPMDTEAPAVTVNKQYAWESMTELLNTTLEKGFEAGADPRAIALPMDKLEKDTVKLICTGTGVMLSQGELYRAYRHSDTTAMPLTAMLKSVVRIFPTMDSYARIAGAEGIELIVYLEGGEKQYNRDNITEFADLLTSAFGEPVLLGEDESVQASEESLDEPKDNEEPPTINLNQPESNIETPEPSPEPSEEPQSDIGRQIEIKKKLVNIRQEPGGKVVFKLKRGKKAEITGEPVKDNGYTWYPISIDGKTGWVRNDTINLLDYVAPSPESDDSLNNELNTPEINAGQYKPLAIGKKGENVKKLQERLKELGYLTAEPDGNYGGKTDRAVRAAQKAFNMKQNGKADEAFQTMLFSDNAITAIDATMAERKPETMKLSLDELKKAQKAMSNRYNKELGGYATGVSLNNAQNSYTLSANAVDNSTSNFEISISFNDAQGALEVNPKFIIKVLNLYVQDIEKVELVKGKNVSELPRELWNYDSGFVTFDLSLDQTALSNMLDKRLATELRFSNATASYTISMDAKAGPYLISKYMRDVWKKLGGQKVAEAADWQMRQN